MELIELENIWKEQDKKITNSISLNKEILKRMLIVKPEKRINWIKIKAWIEIFSPLILLIFCVNTKIQFTFNISFYVGLCIFSAVFILVYIWNVKYFLLTRKIDFSEKILDIKKRIAELEKYKIKTTRIKYLLMPLAMIGIFMMIFDKFPLNKEAIIMYVLIILVFISSLYYTFKISIYEQFKRINSEIEEVESLDKE
jgi:uncharacterized membrane protein